MAVLEVLPEPLQSMAREHAKLLVDEHGMEGDAAARLAAEQVACFLTERDWASTGAGEILSDIDRHSA
ncbi:MAG: hypothetical protein AAGA56_03060 [Myxococcota bacterium]